MTRLVLLVLLLAGCQRDLIVPEKPPQIVRVPVTKYVPLPAELTKDCYDEAPSQQTYSEALRLANIRKLSLDECTKRMKRIRDLQR